MNMNALNELALDEDGLPILTGAVVRDHQPTGEQPDAANRPQATSPVLVADRLLDDEAFRQKFDEFAAKLTVNARQHMKNSLKPAIDEAIDEALNASGDEIYQAITEQLESALPDILARALQDKKTATG